LDTIKEAFDITLKIDLTFKGLVNTKARCSKCVRYGHYHYQCPSKSRHVSIVSSDVDDSKVVEDVHVLSKTISIIENILVGFNTLILDEGRVFYKGTSEVMDVIVESGTPLTVDVHVHDISNFVPELVESSTSSHISRYSFVTVLIEDEIDHKIVDSGVVTSI